MIQIVIRNLDKRDGTLWSTVIDGCFKKKDIAVVNMKILVSVEIFYVL